MTAVILIALLICIAWILVPILKQKTGADYYIVGTEEEQRTSQVQKLKGLLGDLRQEYDADKMTKDEFSTMAAPLLTQLEKAEKATVSSSSKFKKQNKLGIFCHACGALNRLESNDTCFQCGSELKRGGA